MRVAVVVVVVLAAVGVAAVLGAGRDGGSGAHGDPAPPPVIRYTALGDSLATGAGATSSYVVRYAALLEDDTGSDVEVTNIAVDGWTSDDLRRAVEDDEALRATVAEAHTLTFNIGGNDLLRALPLYATGGCGGADNQDCLRAAVAGFASNWDAILAELVELRGADATGLRTMDLYDPSLGAAFASLTDARGYLDEVNQHITTTARELDVPVADVHATFDGARGDDDPAGVIADDGLHPSDQGHAVIAERLAELGHELLLEP